MRVGAAGFACPGHRVVVLDDDLNELPPGQPLTLRLQPGYDHSYYFIQTFIEDHLRHQQRRPVPVRPALALHVRGRPRQQPAVEGPGDGRQQRRRAHGAFVQPPDARGIREGILRRLMATAS